MIDNKLMIWVAFWKWFDGLIYSKNEGNDVKKLTSLRQTLNEGPAQNVNGGLSLIAKSLWGSHQMHERMMCVLSLKHLPWKIAMRFRYSGCMTLLISTASDQSHGLLSLDIRNIHSGEQTRPIHYVWVAKTQPRIERSNWLPWAFRVSGLMGVSCWEHGGRELI